MNDIVFPSTASECDQCFREQSSDNQISEWFPSLIHGPQFQIHVRPTSSMLNLAALSFPAIERAWIVGNLH